jgi:hypothetical protein
LDIADTTGSRRRDTGGRSDTSGRRDTGCCRLVAGDHGDTSLDQLGPRVVKAPDPWMYDWDQIWAGARAVRPKRGRRI